MTRRIFQHTLLLLSTMLVIAFSSCHGSYPVQLTQADSLILHGKYQEADSLLADYDCHASSSKRNRMYRQLLQLERKFVDEKITAEEFSVTDSLSRYYDNWYSQNEYAKTLCLLGETYKVCEDYPSALDAYLRALQIAEEERFTYVTCWLYHQIGDVYFLQRMLPECTNYYRKYYNIAVNNHDTLRMALAADRMGKVSTINNKVDSTIYYYERAIELARHTAHPENIVPFCKYSLSDIYIQIKEFDKAKELMPHDSLNDANWAYWHLGQHHTDSAILYLKKIIDRYGSTGKRETFLKLARLEEYRGNHQKALIYYKYLPAIEDSIRVESQIDGTRRTQAQFNLNLVKKERDQMVSRNKTLIMIVWGALAALIFGSTIVYFAWNYYRQKKSHELVQKELLRKEMEAQYKLSKQQITENQIKIAELEAQLDEAYQRNDKDMADKIKLDTELLAKENQSIEATQRRHEYLIGELRKSPLYIQIKLHAGEENFHLSEADWDHLGKAIDETYNHFTSRLLTLVKLSEVELKTCYLLKIGISPAAIAIMLFKSKTAITMLRQRLYEKITHQGGSARQLDDFILTF